MYTIKWIQGKGNKSQKTDSGLKAYGQQNGHPGIFGSRGIWYNKLQIGEDAMREYTTKEMKLLKADSYTYKVTKNKLYFTVEFKEAFWTAYQAGMVPRKILENRSFFL